MSLLFNMPSRLFIAFLLRNKCLLIPWLQSLSAVILEPKKIKPVTVSIVSPSICHEARILEWIAIPFSRGSSQPRDQIRSPALQGGSLPSEPPANFLVPYPFLAPPSFPLLTGNSFITINLICRHTLFTKHIHFR